MVILDTMLHLLPAARTEVRLEGVSSFSAAFDEVQTI